MPAKEILQNVFLLPFFFFLLNTSAIGLEVETKPPPLSLEQNIYQEYMTCLERVYETMDKNYYRPVTREAFEKFVETFDRSIYAPLEVKNKKSNFVCWRSAAYLVDQLKDSEDTFSAFFPPKAADKYEKKVLGKKVDLGIEGQLTSEGYVVVKIEPRSDAYEKGLRPKDIILAISRKKVFALTQEEIDNLLTPLIDTTVILSYRDYRDGNEKSIKVKSKEYFKQTVFLIPVEVPGVFCLQVKSFNQATADDVFRFLSFIRKEVKDAGLIIDMRGNPGGPPLAARQMSAFFLTGGEDFAYFQRKNQPKAVLSVPDIAKEYQFNGPVAILINKESGSAAELFSGVMQKRKRATLFGVNSAGKVLLKSMFDFDDGSMLLLVTARGHYYDGTVFDFKGLVPDVVVEDNTVDLVSMVAKYLVSKSKEN